MVSALPVGEARIWTLLTASLHADDFLGALSSEELTTAERLHGAHARRDYVVAHALARAALTACEPAVRPDEWTFVTTEHGRPELGGQHLNHQLRFNISHTTDVVACVVTRSVACGIDVERVLAQVDLPTRRILTAEETSLLLAGAAADRPLLYTRLWTAKEAYAKARGLGLLLAFDQLRVSLGDPPTVNDASAGAPVGEWQLDQWRPTTAHVAAAALAVSTAGAVAVSPGALTAHLHVVHHRTFPTDP